MENITIARTRAFDLVNEFARRNKKALDENRKRGDSLGCFEGTPLHVELDDLRKQYLAETDPEITYNTNLFNQAVINFVFKGKKA